MWGTFEQHLSVTSDLEAKQRRGGFERDDVDLAAGDAAKRDSEPWQPRFCHTHDGDVDIAVTVQSAFRHRSEDHGEPHIRF